MRHINIKYIISIVAACLVLSGCGKDAPTQERAQYLRLDNASINVPAIEGDHTVEVTTNTSCKVSTGDLDWIQVGEISFTGNKKLVLHVLENTGASRIGTIGISTRDESITCELTVTQSGK